MSLIIRTLDGKQIRCGFDGPFVDRVMMGDYIIPLPEFCEFAAKILKKQPDVVHFDAITQIAYHEFFSLVSDIVTGGIFGWINIPPCIHEFITKFPEFKDDLEMKHAQNQGLNALFNPSQNFLN